MSNHCNLNVFANHEDSFAQLIANSVRQPLLRAGHRLHCSVYNTSISSVSSCRNSQNLHPLLSNTTVSRCCPRMGGWAGEPWLTRGFAGFEKFNLSTTVLKLLPTYCANSGEPANAFAFEKRTLFRSDQLNTRQRPSQGTPSHPCTAHSTRHSLLPSSNLDYASPRSSN